MSSPLRQHSRVDLAEGATAADSKLSGATLAAPKSFVVPAASAVAIRRGLVRTGEAWFQHEIPCAVDVARFYVHTPVPGAHCSSAYTIDVDLTAPADALLAAMRPETRSKIRRAERDGILAPLWLHVDDGLLARFRQRYDAFAAERAQAPSNGRLMLALRRNGMLAISAATVSSGSDLVWHAYVCCGHRARLLYSASFFRGLESSAARNAIGRANRFLHFRDMLAFKAAGFSTYDLGGWYAGTTDAERLRINHFKEGFGGQLRKYYECELVLTLLGRCALVANGVKRRMSEFGNRIFFGLPARAAPSPPRKPQ